MMGMGDILLHLSSAINILLMVGQTLDFYTYLWYGCSGNYNFIKVQWENWHSTLDRVLFLYYIVFVGEAMPKHQQPSTLASLL
tara:strand:+ start:28 stop:276 length:249 start_codon:yes stop_codon:yes gene_type:complete